MISDIDLTRIKIGVGLVNARGFGYTLLEQSGIPRFLISSVEEGIASGLRLIYWNRDIQSLHRAISKYPHVDFVLLTTHDFVGKLCGKSAGNQLSYRYSPGQDEVNQYNSFYLNHNIFTYPGADSGRAFNKNGDEIKDSGILLLKYKNVILISFPWDFINYTLGSEYSFRPYFSKLLRKNFVEIGPYVDFGKFRKLVISQLIYASDKLGIPLIALRNPFLGGKYFSMRIDADYFQRDAISETLNVSDSSGLKFTWFIDVKGWLDNLATLKVLRDHQQSIQFHCYNHMTYRSEFLNKVNIRKGLGILNRHKIVPAAIVSPNGFYPRGYADAIKKFNFQYSSEFGYDVDDLPSWPENNKDQPMQLPVHPGSFGVFPPGEFTDDEVFSHLYQIVKDRTSADGITILYEHPYYFQNRGNKWNDFFKRLSEDGYKYLNLSDIAKTWKDYTAKSVHLTYDINSRIVLVEPKHVIPTLVQLNNVMCVGDQININKQADQDYADYFSLVNEEGVQKEIDSRQWIMEESYISITAWLRDYYWFNLKVLMIKYLRKLNLYKKK